MSGRFYLRTLPVGMGKRNIKAWTLIRTRLCRGVAEYDELVEMIIGHQPPPSRDTGNDVLNAMAFVDYCEACGWIGQES